MEPSLHIAGAVLAIAAFVPAFFFFIRAGIHFVKMLPHIRSKRHDVVANLVPLLVPFAPQLFTDEGNLHRRAFLTNFSAFLCCAGFIAIMYALLGIPS